MHRKEKDASIVFVSTLIFVCAWVLLVALWEFLDRPLPAHLLTQAVTFLGACMMVFLVRTTSITWRELGLSTKNLRKVLITDSLVAAAGLALMIGAKLVLLHIAPGFFEAGTPFWNWHALRLSGIFYPVTVFLQELISRGLMHESMRRIITGKYRELAAIVVTSLAFGALHLFLGLGRRHPAGRPGRAVPPAERHMGPVHPALCAGHGPRVPGLRVIRKRVSMMTAD